MKVYAIIVSYNGETCIEKAISSLKKSDIPVRIVIVDNNSQDRTIELVENQTDIYLIKNNQNLGFGRANNIGISYALSNDADFVFLLNQDAWVETDTISILADFQKTNKSFGILSPMRVTKNNGTVVGSDGFVNYLYHQNCPDLIPDLINFLKFNIATKPFYEVSFLPAATWLISRACIEKVGGFDPMFFHYGEDANYTQRVKYHGLKIGLSTQASSYHYREDTKHQANPFHEQYSLFERNLKLTLGDINQTKVTYKMRKYKKGYFARMIINLLKINLKEYSKNKRFLQICKKAFPQINISREKNKLKGLSYIEIFDNKNEILDRKKLLVS